MRNLRDEHLGDIEDVALSDDGAIGYVLLSQGGFSGLGQAFVPVRESLQAVPALDSFVPDVSPEVVEQAPRMERDGLADLQQHNQRRDRIDRFWQEPTGWAAPTASRFRVRDRLSS